MYAHGKEICTVKLFKSFNTIEANENGENWKEDKWNWTESYYQSFDSGIDQNSEIAIMWVNTQGIRVWLNYLYPMIIVTDT